MGIQLLINIILSTSIYLLLAISYYVIYAATKEFNLSHAIMICVAPYILYCLYFQCNVNILFATVLSILFTTVLGLISELFIFKSLRKENIISFYVLMASLGLYIIVQNCISMIWGDDTKSIRVGEIKIGHQFLGAHITDIQIITINASFVLFILCVLFLKYHKIGRNIRAVSSNSELCNVVGINSDKIILWAFGIGSALAAVAGILVAFDADMNPTMGFNLLLYGVVAMIIGGVGSTWGLLEGALLLATAQHLAAYYIGSQWMNAIAYIILILFLLWKPLGFSGKRLKKVEI